MHGLWCRGDELPEDRWLPIAEHFGVDARLLSGERSLAAAALAASLLRRGRRGTRRLMALAVAAFLLALPPALVVAVQGSEREWDDRAVLLVPRAEARSGPAETNPLLFTVHEGTTVTIHDQREGWTRISLPDGLIGWVPAQSIEAIRP